MPASGLPAHKSRHTLRLLHGSDVLFPLLSLSSGMELAVCINKQLGACWRKRPSCAPGCQGRGGAYPVLFYRVSNVLPLPASWRLAGELLFF